MSREHVWNSVNERKQTHLEELASVPFCPSQTQHGLALDRIQVFVAKDQWLTPWALLWPTFERMQVFGDWRRLILQEFEANRNNINSQRHLVNMETAKNKAYVSRVVTPALHTAEVLSCLQPHQRTWTKEGTQALKEVHGIDSHVVRNVESSKRMLTMTSLLNCLVQVKNRAVKTRCSKQLRVSGNKTIKGRNKDK
jgi:hypothetical protein